MENYRPARRAARAHEAALRKFIFGARCSARAERPVRARARAGRARARPARARAANGALSARAETRSENELSHRRFVRALNPEFRARRRARARARRARAYETGRFARELKRAPKMNFRTAASRARGTPNFAPGARRRPNMENHRPEMEKFRAAKTLWKQDTFFMCRGHFLARQRGGGTLVGHFCQKPGVF